MSEENEKIIYNIEIQTNVEKAKQELGKLKQDLKASNHEEILVNLSFQGTEKFKTIQQNLSQIKKAIEILKRDGSARITLNGADVGLTLNKLRAMEKEWEDFRKTVNSGNLNKQIKEQQKLQGELEKTITKLNQLRSKFNDSFTNNKAFSEKELHNTIQQAEQLTNKINGLYKQMGMNATLVNPLKGHEKDYDSYFSKTKEKAIQSQKEINDAKITQAKKANAQIIKDEQKAITSNTQAHKSAWEEFSNIENVKEKQYKKINQLLEQRRRLVNDINLSLRTAKAFSEKEFVNKTESGNKLIRDLSALGVRTTNPMGVYEGYQDYMKKTKQYELEQEAIKKQKLEQELKAKLLLEKAEEKRLQQEKKYQSELDKTREKIKQIEKAFERSFTNKRAWSDEKLASKIAEIDTLAKKANTLNDLLKTNITTRNPLEDYRGNYGKYYSKTRERDLKITKELNKESEKASKLVDIINTSLSSEKMLSQGKFESILEKYDKAMTRFHNNLEQNKHLENKIKMPDDSLVTRDYSTYRTISTEKASKLEKANERYNNLIDEANKKKELGIQLSQKDYAILQRKIQAQEKEISFLGGAEPTRQLPSREDFNRQAMQNYFAGNSSKALFDLDTVTSYSEKMSKLSHILDTATYAWERSGRTNKAYKRTMIEARAEIEKTSKALQKIHEQTGKSLSLGDKMSLGLRTHATWIASSVLASVPLVLPSYGAGVMKDIESKFATVEQVMPEIEKAHKNSLDKNLSDSERAKNAKKVTDEMNAFIDISKQYGVAVEEVIEAGASLGRMYGKGDNGIANTNLLTKQASRIAVADNFSMIQATKGLESALSQFGLQTEDTNQLLINSNRIIDVWTKTAHTGGASAQDLTEGVALAGASAHQAGISFEFLNAMIATGVRATGRSGNEIGNSIKSFLNSMQSTKSINMLKDFGIDVYKTNADGTKSFRSMEEVVLDVSRMLQTTNKDTSELLLTLAGGKYQVSKLTAILKDYRELVHMTGELNAKDVQGFTDEQINIQLETLYRKLEQMSNSFKGLFVDIGNNGGLASLKTFADTVNNITTGVREMNIAWGSWVKTLILGVVALKGVPALINLIARQVGRVQGINKYRERSATGSVLDMLGIDWSGNRAKGQAGIRAEERRRTNRIESTQDNADRENYNNNSGSGGTDVSMISADTKETEKNTKAKSKNSKISKLQTGTIGKVTNALKSSTVVTKGASLAMSGFSKVIEYASMGLRFLGGPIGVVITILTTLVPIVLEHANAVGEETNSLKNAKDAMEEYAQTAETEYNAKQRAIETAENLARNYNELQDKLNTLTEGTEQYDNVSKDSKATMDALQKTLTTLGMKDDEVTALRDENGKIIISNITDQKKKTAEMALADVKSKISMNNAEVEVTKNKIAQTKERIEAMKKEVQAIGTVERAMNSLNAFFNRAKASFYEQMVAMQYNSIKPNQAIIDEFKKNAQEAKENADMLNTKNNKDKMIREYEKDLEKYEEALKKQQEEADEKNKSLIPLQAELQQNINAEKYDMGGADSNRGDGIVEEPKGNKGSGGSVSKAQRETERKERQEKDYAKATESSSLVAIERANNYSLRKTSFTDVANTTGIDNQEAWTLANQVAQMAGRQDLAKSIYSQWAFESGRFSTDSGTNNYAGLKDTSGNYRNFNSMQEFADAYYNDFLSRYNLDNVGFGDTNGFVHELKRNGYFTADEGTYANGVSNIANEIREAISSSVANSLNEQYYDISDEVSSTSLKPNTSSKLNLLAKKFYNETGEKLLVTSMKRFGDGSSWHDSGEAFDVVSPLLEQNAELRNRIMNQSENIGLTPLDEYANPSANATGKHLHFSNRNDNATGLNEYQASLSETSLATDTGLAYHVLSGLGVDQNKLNALATAKDVPSFISLTDSAGMNLTHAQATPTAGDIVYTKNGKAYVVSEGGGYIGTNGERGESYKNLNLTDTFTSRIQAMGLTLENASQKLSSLKITDKVKQLSEYRINRDDNARSMYSQQMESQNKLYDYNKKEIDARRAMFGEYDAQAYIKEYVNEKNNYKSKELNFNYLSKRQDELEKELTEKFKHGFLNEIMTKSGYNDWTEISNEQLSKLAETYDNAIGTQDFSKLIRDFVSIKDAVKGANEELTNAEIIMRKLEGFRSIQQEYEFQANKIKTDTEFWKSNYKNETGSYDGLEWRTNKRQNEDAKKELKELNKVLNNLIQTRNTLLAQDGYSKQHMEMVTQQITEVKTHMNELEKVVEDTKDKLTKQNKETISSMLHDLIKGGKSLKDVWKNIWDSIAEVAIKRMVGIKDATNPMWDLFTNMLGIGRGRTKNRAGRIETENYVDGYNDRNETMGRLAYRDEGRNRRGRNQNSEESIMRFFNREKEKEGTAIDGLTGMSKENLELQASQNMLLASQQMMQTTSLDQMNTMQDQANTMQDTFNTSQDVMATSQEQMAINTFDLGVNKFDNSVNSMALGGGGSGGGGGGGFNWIGLIPNILSLFHTGGSIRKFATGGNFIDDGGIIEGAGTGTSDSILAYLADQGKFIGVSNGEYIMNSKATRKYGNILEQMNLDKFATGGSIAPEAYVPTLNNPTVANNIIKQEAQKNNNNNAKMEELLGKQNTILTGIANQDNSDGGNVTILNTRASKEEIFGELAKDPRALQRLLGSNRKHGFR